MEDLRPKRADGTDLRQDRRDLKLVPNRWKHDRIDPGPERCYRLNCLGFLAHHRDLESGIERAEKLSKGEFRAGNLVRIGIGDDSHGE